MAVSTAPRASTIHELKIWPTWFMDVATGRKSFELREDDRGFQAGDLLKLREYVPRDSGGHYTGNEVLVSVTYLLRGGPWLAKNHVAMGIRVESFTIIGSVGA